MTVSIEVSVREQSSLRPLVAKDLTLPGTDRTTGRLSGEHADPPLPVDGAHLLQRLTGVIADWAAARILPRRFDMFIPFVAGNDRRKRRSLRAGSLGYYQCAAVDEIDMKSKGIKRYEWRIKLRSGNPREWFEEHLETLFDRIVTAQTDDRSGPIRSLMLEAPTPTGGVEEVWRVWSDQIGNSRPLGATEIRPRRSVAVYGRPRMNFRTCRSRGRSFA